MKVEFVNGTLVVAAESKEETESLKAWRKRRKDKNVRWLEVHYCNPEVVII